jgi:hypothetical protein
MLLTDQQHCSSTVYRHSCHQSAPVLSGSTLLQASKPTQHRSRAGQHRQRCCRPQAELSGDRLERQFAEYVNTSNIQEPSRDRRPSHLLSPAAAVAAQMNALQRNDWPEQDAGIKTAFLFTKPHGCEAMVHGPPLPSHVRSWLGKEAWIPLSDFCSMLRSPPFSAILDFDSWQAVSDVVFPSNRYGNKAVQAVQVSDSADRQLTYTFCLERVEEGPYKGCWMTVGLRSGDYSH